MTFYKEEYNRLKDKILSDLEIKVLKINAGEGEKILAPEVLLLENLEELRISKNGRIKEYPAEIADLSRLKTIRHIHSNLKRIPAVLGEILSLEYLYLSHNSFNKKTNWSPLSRLKKLKILDLSFALQTFDCFPEALCNLQRLETMDISNNQISRLPACFSMLKMLRVLNASGNNFDAFPLILCELPKLQALTLPVESLKLMDTKALKLLKIEDIKFSGAVKSPLIHDLKSLVQTLRKGQFTERKAALFLNVTQQKTNISSLNNADLIALLHCGVRSCINRALLAIETRIRKGILGQNNLPKEGQKVFFVGKTRGKTAELKQLFWDKKISTGRKIPPKTAFIILGENPNIDASIILERKWNILTEQMAIRYLSQQQPDLLEELHTKNRDGIDKIRALFLSMQSENIDLGLALLKHTRAPTTITTTLFLLYKVSTDPKQKRSIYDILRQITPLDFGVALKHRKKIGPSVSELTLRRNLEYYGSLTKLNNERMASFLMEKFGKGILFALFNLTTDAKKIFFSTLMQAGKLRLTSLALRQLPPDFAAIEGLIHLDLSSNKFSTVPEVLYACSELKSINLTGNQDIFIDMKKIICLDNLNIIYVDQHQKGAIEHTLSLAKHNIRLVLH